MDERVELANQVIRTSLGIRRNEEVIVESWNGGLDLAKEIVFRLRALGAKPMFLLEDEETYWRSVETLPSARLGQVSRSEWAALSEADAYIFLPGPADIARIRKNRDKFQASIAYDEAWYRRAARAGVRGARVLVSYTTRQRAALYGLEAEAWRSAVVRAALTDYRAIAREGKKVVELLSEDAEVELTAPNGTSLTFGLNGRRPWLEDGIVDAADMARGDILANLPPGQVYVAPDERSATGLVHAELPVPYLGTMVQGIHFEFKEGDATWSADQHGHVLRTDFSRAVGPRRRFAALSIGLNPAMKYGWLQDGIVRGSVGISIGDNSVWGGRNRSSFFFEVHLNNATVRVGGRTLIESGSLRV